MTPDVTKLPPIVPILATIAFIYAAGELAPTIARATLGLLVLYVVLTHVAPAIGLIGKVDIGARKLIAPPAAAGGGGRVTLR